MSYVRDTSREAYECIKAEGLLNQLQWSVYAYLYRHGPMTSGEAHNGMYPQHGIVQKVPSQVRARFTELRNMGVFKEVGERACKVTGLKCILWDVTPDLPKEPSDTGAKRIRKALRVLTQQRDTAESILLMMADWWLAGHGCCVHEKNGWQAQIAAIRRRRLEDGGQA